MRKLFWSPQALRELEGIRDVAIDSSRYAALVIERIINGVERLPRFRSRAAWCQSSTTQVSERSSSSTIAWSMG